MAFQHSSRHLQVGFSVVGTAVTDLNMLLLEGPGNFGLEKPLSTQCDILWHLENKITEDTADDEGSKDSTGHLCEETVRFGQQKLETQL